MMTINYTFVLEHFLKLYHFITLYVHSLILFRRKGHMEKLFLIDKVPSSIQFLFFLYLYSLINIFIPFLKIGLMPSKILLYPFHYRYLEKDPIFSHMERNFTPIVLPKSATEFSYNASLIEIAFMLSHTVKFSARFETSTSPSACAHDFNLALVYERSLTY